MKANETHRRMVSCFAQIIRQYVLGYKISGLAKDEPVKARKLSYASQIHLMMLGHFLHLFSLNELVDVSKIYGKELSRIRDTTPTNLNTLSNANRTRNPEVAKKFFWIMYEYFSNKSKDFLRVKHSGRLSRFKFRTICAIDSTTIKLAHQCIKWARHRQHKAAVKIHMAADVASCLPRFCVYGKANEHDSKKEEVLFEALNPGDVGILDRAYNNFEVLYKQSQRGVIFVLREKENMQFKIETSKAKDALPEGVISDETIRLTGSKTKDSYPEPLRRVRISAEVDGNVRELVFLTNNFEWSPRTIGDLYKSRWAVELLFKELKQTLQLRDFFGENENAVQWQIWTALLCHLILRYIKWESKASCSYSRFVALIRAVIWLKKDLFSLLQCYGIAPPPKNTPLPDNIPYLPGFEKYFRNTMG